MGPTEDNKQDDTTAMPDSPTSGAMPPAPDGMPADNGAASWPPTPAAPGSGTTPEAGMNDSSTTDPVDAGMGDETPATPETPAEPKDDGMGMPGAAPQQ